VRLVFSTEIGLAVVKEEWEVFQTGLACLASPGRTVSASREGELVEFGKSDTILRRSMALTT
jgi:hypothetical protein